MEIVDGKHDFVPPAVRQEIAEKVGANCAVGILNAPDPSYCPMTDERIETNYGPDDHVVGKRENKLALQKKLGLVEDPNAPVFFWPSRLDPSQKGCQLLTHILYEIIATYWENKLQVVVVANGTYQEPFRNIVKFHEIFSRAAVCDFDEALSRQGYAGSDFMFMPSLFEPCGLPQMIGTIYGTLPLVHDTGGLHDTIEHLNTAKDTGNGFVFETFDSGGLRWAVDQAMLFHVMPEITKEQTIARIMTEGKRRFNHAVTAKAYFDIYEEMLQRPLVPHF
jgi:starch synthase/alpha-amylase